MIFCSNCGYELNGSEKHCPECGMSLEAEFSQEESKSIFKSKFSKKIQKFGQETKKQIDNFDFEEFKQDASKATEDTLKDIQDYVDVTTKKSIIKKAYDNFEKEKYEKTIEYCDRILKDEFLEDIYLLKAKSIFNLERHDEAINLIFNKLPEVNNIEYVLFLADSYKTLHKFDTSIEYYNHALKIDDGNFKALIGKAYACSEAKYYRLAIEYFKKAGEIEDLNDEDYYSWSDNLCNIRDYETAYNILIKSDCEKYADKLDYIKFKRVFNTSDCDLILKFAKEKFNQFDWETTLIYLNKYLEFNENNSEVWLLITKCEYYLANYEDSLDSCRNLLALENNADNMNLKGEILIGLKKFDEAIKVFKKALKSHSNYYLTYANLGFAYAFMGDNLNAKDNFDKSLNYEHNARAWIGKCYSEDKYTDLYISAAYRNIDEENIELIASKCFESILYWNTAASDMKYNLEKMESKELIKRVGKNFDKSLDLFSDAYELFKKFNLSKDFWLTDCFFKLINYKFLNLSKQHYYRFWDNSYFTIYPSSNMESRNAWLKIGDILFEMYDDINYIIEQANINMEFLKYDEALEKYDQAIKYNNKHFNCYNLMYHDLLGYKAGVYKSKALCHDIDSKKYKENMSKSFNFYNASISGYDVFLRKDPNNEDILIRKAINLVKTYRRAEGLLIYEKILKLNPDHKDALKGIRSIYTLK